MNENIKLIYNLYKNIEMAVFSSDKLLEDLEGKNNKIKDFVQELLSNYQEYQKKAKEILILNNIDVEKNDFMKKLGARIGIKKEITNDNSDAAIAKMLSKGIEMGLLNMKKNLKIYKSVTNKEHLKLVNSFIKFSEESNKKCQKYL